MHYETESSQKPHMVGKTGSIVLIGSERTQVVQYLISKWLKVGPSTDVLKIRKSALEWTVSYENSYSTGLIVTLPLSLLSVE